VIETYPKNRKGLDLPGVLYMGPSAEIDQRAASVYCAAPAIGDSLLNKMKLVWTVLEHPDKIGLGHDETLATLFLLNDGL
jgi:hypothetical protein